MAFIRKMVFQRKSNASPINLWNKILGQFKLRVFTKLKTFTVLAWFTTFELAVVPMNTSAKLDSIWNSGAKIGLFSASLNAQNDSRFHSGNFSKGKALYCAKVSYELLAYNTSLACVFVTAMIIIYVQNGFSVGSYSLNCSYFSWNNSL